MITKKALLYDTWASTLVAGNAITLQSLFWPANESSSCAPCLFLVSFKMRAQRFSWTYWIPAIHRRTRSYSTMLDQPIISTQLKSRPVNWAGVWIACFKIIAIVMIIFLVLQILVGFALSFDAWWKGQLETEETVIPIRLFSSENLLPHFDPTAGVYHLALKNQNWTSFARLRLDANNCYRSGTNQSAAEACHCHATYFGRYCSLPIEWRSNFETDTMIQTFNISVQPSVEPNIVFASVLYDCEDGSKCDDYVDQLTSQFDHLVNLFLFIDLRYEKNEFEQLNETDLHEYSSPLNSAHVSADVASRANTSNELNAWSSNANVVRRIHRIRSTSRPINDSILDKSYRLLWHSLFFSVTNYRLQDRIILTMPFTMPEPQAIELIKFHTKYPEPLYLKQSKHRSPSAQRMKSKSTGSKHLAHILNRVYSIQYILSLCLFDYERMRNQRCVDHPQLKLDFEQSYWPINQSNIESWP